MAEPKLVIGGDTSGAEAAVARLERRLEAAEQKIARVKSTAAKPIVDPLAMKMSGGTTGDAMTGRLNAFAASQRQLAAQQADADKDALARKERLTRAAETHRRLYEMDSARSARNQPVALSPAATDLAAKQQQRLAVAQRMQAAADADARRATFDPSIGGSFNRVFDQQKRIADARKTHSIISQVRAQQAAKSMTDDLAKQPGLLDAAGAGALRYLGPLAAAGAAVKLISNEWNNVIDRQNKAGQTKLTIEQALGEAALNVGQTIAPEKLEAEASRISQKTGVDKVKLITASSNAIKTSGAQTEAEALRIISGVEDVAALTPWASVDQLADSSGAIGSVMARTGARGKQVSGKLLSMQSKSNIRDLNKAMSVLSPVLSNMLMQGASDPLAETLAPSISQVIEDSTGEESAYAAVKFTDTLMEQFANREGFKGKKNIPDLAIAAMRADPELAKQFWEGTLTDESGNSMGTPDVGRSRARTYLRAITGDPTLQGDDVLISRSKSSFDASLKNTLSMEDSGSYYEERLRQAQRVTPLTEMSNRLKSTTVAITRDRDAEAGVLRGDLKSLLKASGQSDLEQKISGIGFDLNNQYAVQETVRQIRERAMEVATEKDSFFGGVAKSWQWSDANNDEQKRLTAEWSAEAGPEIKKRTDALILAAEALERIAGRQVNRNGNVENN